jgi:hypothetical protein
MWKLQRKIQRKLQGNDLHKLAGGKRAHGEYKRTITAEVSYPFNRHFFNELLGAA